MSKPDVSVGIYLSECGFQVDVVRLVNGKKEEFSVCRDFAGEYVVSRISDVLVDTILDSFYGLEKKLRNESS